MHRNLRATAWLALLPCSLIWGPAESRAAEDWQEGPPPVTSELARPAPAFNVNVKTSAGPMPSDESNDLFGPPILDGRRRSEQETVVTWAASNISYQPLYFEDVPLERYGQGNDLTQPLESGAKFLFDAASLPYQIGLDRPCDRVYALGYYRPGGPTPCLQQGLPWDPQAAAAQVGTVLGLVFLLP